MEQLAIIQQSVQTKYNVIVISLEGVLNINSAEELGIAFRELFEKKQYRIVLNIGKLTYLSSAGIGLVMANLKEVRENGGDIKISNTPPDIFKVFELVELPALIQMFKHEEDAIAGFQ
jgi:stage II sporulation protein AA (anti-sigma F factor antagonist)